MATAIPPDGVPSGHRRKLADRLAALLTSCRPATIARLVETARLRTLRSGDVIYPQGEPVPLTLILEGYGISRRTTRDGQDLASGVAKTGTLFGYSSISGELSSVEIVAVTDCVVAQWSGSQARALCEQDSALALVAIDSMAASLHQTIETIDGFLHQDARRRVLRILARHRNLFFDDPPVLNRTHLPGLVGTTAEMTRRVLRQLEKEGTVERVGRTRLRLLEPSRLENG